MSIANNYSGCEGNMRKDLNIRVFLSEVIFNRVYLKVSQKQSQYIILCQKEGSLVAKIDVKA